MQLSRGKFWLSPDLKWWDQKPTTFAVGQRVKVKTSRDLCGIGFLRVESNHEGWFCDCVDQFGCRHTLCTAYLEPDDKPSFVLPI